MQVHKLLKAVAPIRYLFALGCGFAKLFSLQTKNFRKDQHLLKGLQKGLVDYTATLDFIPCA